MASMDPQQLHSEKRALASSDHSSDGPVCARADGAAQGHVVDLHARVLDQTRVRSMHTRMGRTTGARAAPDH